jgi:hypothetical protein
MNIDKEKQIRYIVKIKMEKTAHYTCTILNEAVKIEE